MIPEVDRVELESALDHFDQDFRSNDDWRNWEDNQAHKYAIEWNGRRYPVKKVVSLATGSPVSNFSGGEEANEFVTKLGFKVVPLRGNSGPIPRHWIFQGNPDRWDLEGALDELPEMTWLVNQYFNVIHQNDRVFLWLSGAEGGICATATVLTEPAFLEEAEAERKFNRDQSKFEGTQRRVRLRIDARIQPRLTRTEIKTAPELMDLSIIKFSNATNFEVSESQTEAILRLLSGREIAPVSSNPEAMTKGAEATNVWWVNQGSTYDHEKNGGYLWAPLKDKGGGTQNHWERMDDVRIGDLIVHYCNGEIRAVSRVAAQAIKQQRPKNFRKMPGLAMVACSKLSISNSTRP